MAQVMTHAREEPRWTRLSMASGATLEGMAGAAAIVLTIIGLAGLYSYFLLGVSVILVGIALVMEGGAVAARLTAAMHEVSEGRVQLSELGGGVSWEFLGGIAGIALGIIGLVGAVPLVLWPIAAIVFGAAHLFGSASTAQIRTLRYSGESENIRRLASNAARGAAGVQGLIGAAGIVLGILALLGFVPLTLTLIAILAFGFADLLRAPTIGTKAVRNY